MKIFHACFLRSLQCCVFAIAIESTNCHSPCTSITSNTFDQLLCKLMSSLHEEAATQSQDHQPSRQSSSSSIKLSTDNESRKSKEDTSWVGTIPVRSSGLWREEDLFRDVSSTEEILDQDCGRTLLSQLIVGGRAADRLRWPWMVRLGRRLRWGGISWRCGGSLISSKLVLTAAHCYNHVFSIKDELIRIGEYDASTTSDSEYQDVPIIEVLRPISYRPQMKHHDISLVRLNQAVPLDSNQYHAICLPLPNSTEPIHRVTVAGWGRTDFFDRSTPDLLQEATLQVVNTSVCEAAYREHSWFNRLFAGGFGDTKLCATWKGGVARDACVGDSGGPAVAYDHEHDRYRLIGIVSSGVKCAIQQFPGIYTRVEKYRQWILANKDRTNTSISTVVVKLNPPSYIS